MFNTVQSMSDSIAVFDIPLYFFLSSFRVPFRRFLVPAWHASLAG